MRAELDHIALNVEDISISCDFYEKVMFFEIERLEAFEKGLVSFPSVRINEETVIDLFPPQMWKKNGGIGETKNLNHLCLALSEAEWNGLNDRLKAKGIKIERYADNNWGAQGIGISVYFFDPDGNEIEARFYRNE